MSAKYKAKGKNYRAKSQDTIQDNPENFFPTYHSLTRHIMKMFVFRKEDVFLEPCAGAGDITKVIKEFYPNNLILSCDINPRKTNICNCDFLSEDNISGWSCEFHIDEADFAITNPPFKLFMEFFKKCTMVVKQGILFICPLDYLHGVERYETIYKNGYNGFRLKTVFPFVRRPLFGAKWHPAGKIPTGATSFAWFYFENGFIGNAIIDHLHNNDDMGQPIEADQILMEDIKNDT